MLFQVLPMMGSAPIFYRLCSIFCRSQAALAAKWKEPPRVALDTMVLKTGLKLPQVCVCV